MGGQAFCQAPHSLIRDVLGTFNVGSHTRAMMLHGLEAADGPPKLGPSLGIFNGHFQNSLGTPQHLNALSRSRPHYRTFNNWPGFTHGSDHVACSDDDIFQFDLIDTLVTNGTHWSNRQTVNVSRH